ncbi:hypothetical protein J8281_04925 [Aquimarina sp. U1-2]|uniref:hypothetical protein n=1 Tax=Aquimarina sp. U1-2 TaxID=2823141 RepID=UPI001AED0965|nr:hypothetical protein [Aquimarina sp. U1-2]MBP2831524.1 hypothetical protein [Aquimarina sp. U1-2]
MNENDIKKIIKKSKVKTKADFTDNVLTKLEAECSTRSSIKLWPLHQIILGFVAFTVISGFLFYGLSKNYIPDFNPIVPLLWALMVLLGLNYVLGLSKQRNLADFK